MRWKRNTSSTEKENPSVHKTRKSTANKREETRNGALCYGNSLDLNGSASGFNGVEERCWLSGVVDEGGGGMVARPKALVYFGRDSSPIETQPGFETGTAGGGSVIRLFLPEDTTRAVAGRIESRCALALGTAPSLCECLRELAYGFEVDQSPNPVCTSASRAYASASAQSCSSFALIFGTRR
jgi:hypothetical protein